ncbi:hypothetical protein FACS189416_6160 [Bacteroidia bacterium]|nr:hypothetical protein FACS189416_6160 [Bacteroidia bacterium]
MKKFGIYLISLALLSACTTEEITKPSTGPDTKGTVDPTEVTFMLSFPETTQNVTRAITDLEENQIDSIRLFVFRSGGYIMDDVYMYNVSIPGDSIHIDGTSPVGNDPASHDPGYYYRAMVKLKATTYRQRFVLVANPPANLNTYLAGLSENTTTIKQFNEMLSYSGAPYQEGLNSPTPPPTKFTKAFPMFGHLTDSFTISATTGPNSPPAIIIVPMVRALAKITIGVDVNNPAGDDPALGFGHIFVIDSVYVCNASENGYISPDSSYLKAIFTNNITKVHAPNPRKTSIGYKFPDLNTLTKRTLTNTIYIPETDTLPNAAFLVIKARYYGNPAYYRVDFTKNDKYQPLIRNHNYLVNITGIRKLGYTNLTDAINAPAVTLNPYLELDNEDAIIRDIVYNKDSWLGSATTDLKIDWMAQKGVPIAVKTNFPGGIQIKSVTSDANWLPSGYVSLTGPDASGLYFLHIDPTDNLTGAPRKATITIAAGTMVQTITVTQGYGSYSYIVQQGQSIEIPITSAYVSPLLTTGTVEILWSQGSSAGLGTPNLSNSKITVNVSLSCAPGPAVIGLRNGAGGAVLWSWLVWVLPSGEKFEGPTNTKTFNGYTFMKYDLGQDLTTSLADPPIFQWGRKDALYPPGSSLTNSSLSMAIADISGSNINSTVLNPTTIYLSNTHPYDWKKDYQNNNLWQTTDEEKGPYDPCPFGWRVPPANNDPLSPWAGFTNGANDLTFDTTRKGVDGVSGNTITNAGYFWSASVRSTDSYGYKADVGGQTNHRANAYPVRCIRDNVKKIQGN